MTASEKTGRPAEPAAEPGGEPGTGLSPHATVGDSPETDPLTGSIVASDDPQQLEQEIERTREQLGQTVQELAARADVKSRARARAASAAGRVKSTTIQAGQNAAARAGSVRSQVAGKAAAVSAPVWQATPEPLRRTVTKGASRARDQWVPLAAAAAVLIVGYLAFRQWGGRQSDALSRSQPDQPGEQDQGRHRQLSRLRQHQPYVRPAQNGTGFTPPSNSSLPRPDVSQVDADHASVMRCLRALPSDGG